MHPTPNDQTPLPRPASRRALEPSTGGLTIRRVFTRPGVDPLQTVEWTHRDAVIRRADGGAVFEQRDVEVPATWSATACNVVASKYLRGAVGAPERETSIRQLLTRVCHTIAGWGRADGYFATDENAAVFRDELTWLCLHQHMAFNSPVWFNVGVVERPQCSACFINSVEDNLGSILDLAKTEALLFKWGSGSGSNLSSLRGSNEPLSGGGTASGPVSFMRGFDSFAGVIKSGGKTRRAAKMVILDVDHPDILQFVRCKADEERKAWALIETGYDGGFHVPGGAYDSVGFQNANHSVRVSDAFMEAVRDDRDWELVGVASGDVVGTISARTLLSEIAEAAWVCGDPGLQYDDAINRSHTCPSTARINASNPCSEYMFLDDSACNLASLNLMRFRDDRGRFDVERFDAACRLTLTAQEILVDRASYPTPRIAANSGEYRPLGLGYANLGALLMAEGLPYDSPEARERAAGLTAVMTGAAYARSAEIAESKGAFGGYERNREPMLLVMEHHASAARGGGTADDGIREHAAEVWDEVLERGRRHGYRNAQATVIAPTGTIAFMMDCDTTGIEPDIALVKTKTMVGGGSMRLVNGTVSEALERLGYREEQRRAIVEHLEARGTIEGAPGLAGRHLAVFDCAFEAPGGSRSIGPEAHIAMMAAVQPMISGAISKTVNVPGAYTAEQIAGLYTRSWELGLKAVAIYRDGSKRTQPLNAGVGTPEGADAEPVPAPVRRRLPVERAALTHKFTVGGHDGYITVGLYDDGTPGEIFLVMSKEGSVVSGMLDAFATAVSMALQYGVPIQALCTKFSHMRFEPSGFTGNPNIPMAKSILDYVFRWLELKYGDPDARQPTMDQVPLPFGGGATTGATAPAPELQADAPPCTNCGAITVRSASCYLCFSCGSSNGCS